MRTGTVILLVALCVAVSSAAVQLPPSPAEIDPAQEAASLARQLRSDLAKASPDEADIYYCLGRLSLLGDGGIETLCRYIADPKWGETATYDLAAMLDRRMSRAVQVGGPRPFRQPEPAFGQPAIAALARAVPLLKAQAIHGDIDAATPAAAVAVLTVIAPRLKPALTALIELAAADRVPVAYRPATAALIVTADLPTRRKFENAKPARDGFILKLVGMWLGSPAQAAKQIMAMDADQKSLVLTSLPDDPKRVTPVLIELLADPNWSDDLLRKGDPLVTPAARAALSNPNPLIRARAATLLPDNELTGGLGALAAALGKTTDATAAAETIRQALCRAGDAAIEPISKRLEDPDPIARAAAARALGWFAPSAAADQPNTTETGRARAAVSLVTGLADPDAPTRMAVLTSLGKLGPAASSPALAPVLKKMPEKDLNLLTETMTAASVESRNTEPATTRDIADLKALDLATAAVAALRRHDDQAVRNAADSVVLARDLALDDLIWTKAPSRPLSDQQRDAVSKLRSIGQNAEQRSAALNALSGADTPEMVDVLSPLLLDPDPACRINAARYLTSQHAFIRRPEVVTAVVETWQTDPDSLVRRGVGQVLTQWFNYATATGARLRLHAMAVNADKTRRRAVASILTLIAINHDEQSQKSYRSDLERLCHDSALDVRIAAAHCVAAWIGPREPSDSFSIRLAEEFLNSKDQAERIAAIDALYLLPAEKVEQLTSSPDPALRAAALLTLELPPGSSTPVPSRRVQVKTAAVALNGRSPRFRQMAIQTLTYDDPSDPRRPDAGLQAILDAANGPDEEVAIDALRPLVPGYCGVLAPDPATHRFFYTSNGPMPKPLPIPWPVAITRMVNAARTGPIADRIKIIRQIGSSEPRYLAGRYDLFELLLMDPESSIRAEAFRAARTVIFRAVAEKRKLHPSNPSSSTRPYP